MRKCPSWIAEARDCGAPTPRRPGKAEELRELGLPSVGRPVVRVVEALELSDSRLKWVDLSGLELALPLLERLGTALGHTQVLEQLYLVGCGLSDKGVAAVAAGAANCRQLKTLAVGENKFGNAGLVSLARMMEKSELRSFSAAGMPIRDAAGYVLFNSLVHNRSLRRLDLARTALGAAAIPWVALLIRNTTSLQVIDLRGIAVVASAREELATACAEAGFELAEKSTAARRVLVGAPVEEPDEPLFAPPAVRRLLGGADGEPRLTRSCAQFKPGPKRPPDEESLRRRAAARRPPRWPPGDRASRGKRLGRPQSAGPRLGSALPGAGEQNARRAVEAARARDRAQDCGAFDLAGLRELCRRRYQNPVRAWNVLFDPNHTRSVGFRAFCNGARSLGFQGGLRETFRGLGRGEDFISLEHWDPAAFQELQQLRSTLLALLAAALVPQGKVIEDLDDVKQSCFDLLDANASGRISREEFREALATLPDFEGDADRLFDYLDLSPVGDSFISVDEFVRLDFPTNEQFRAHPATTRSTSPEHADRSADRFADRSASPGGSASPTGSASARRRRHGSSARGGSRQQRGPAAAADALAPGGREWRKLAAELAARYGWVRIFRDAGAGSMTSATFVNVVGRLKLAWEGSLYSAFRESPQQHGRLFLGDVAPEVAPLLDAFRVWVGRRHTLHELATLLRLTPQGAKEADFVQCCGEALEISEAHAVAVYAALGRVNYGALTFVYAGPFRRG